MRSAELDGHNAEELLTLAVRARELDSADSIAQVLHHRIERRVEREAEALRRVDEDVATADASGVAGTPTFFINGRRHHGAYDVASLTAAVAASRTRARLRLHAKKAQTPGE